MKLNSKEINELMQGHTSHTWCSWHLNICLWTPVTYLCTTPHTPWAFMFSLCLVEILWDAIFIPYYISQWNPLLLGKSEVKRTAKRDMSPGLHKKTIHWWALCREWRHRHIAFCHSLTQLLPFSDTSHVGRMKNSVAKGSSTLNWWKCVAFCLLGKLDCSKSGAE